MRPEIMAYYQRLGERDRLTGPAGRLEFLRTWDVLTRVLPPPPARILDVGGATGVYAAPLAAAGHRVHLVDPVPDQVAVAGELPGVTAEVGDARQLRAGDDSYQAVLLLGPLYHLPQLADRLRVWREAARVLAPGGVIVAAVITRFASTLDGFVKGYHADPEFVEIYSHTQVSGEHRGSADGQRYFTTAYFHRPDEVPDEVVAAGLTLERLVSVEGPAWMFGTLPAIMSDEPATALLLEQLRRLEGEPSLFGASSHLLAVARDGASGAGGDEDGGAGEQAPA